MIYTVLECSRRFKKVLECSKRPKKPVSLPVRIRKHWCRFSLANDQHKNIAKLITVNILKTFTILNRNSLLTLDTIWKVKKGRKGCQCHNVHIGLAWILDTFSKHGIIFCDTITHYLLVLNIVRLNRSSLSRWFRGTVKKKWLNFGLCPKRGRGGVPTGTPSVQTYTLKNGQNNESSNKVNLPP